MHGHLDFMGRRKSAPASVERICSRGDLEPSLWMIFLEEKVLLAALKSLTRRMFLVLAHGASLAADELPEGW